MDRFPGSPQLDHPKVQNHLAPSIVQDIPERLSLCVKTILQAASVMPDPKGKP